MLSDWPLDQLRDYRPERSEPADFDRFWADTLAEAADKAFPARFEPYDSGLSTVDVYDVTFAGYAGQPVRGWFYLPRGTTGRLPCVVEYIGYGSGRGLPHDWLFWSATGHAHLVMDSRGQGSGGGGSLVGHTPDPDPVGTPQAPGFLTRGLPDRDRYYYRRLFTDAARAVHTVRDHPSVDPERIILTGGSQGGGMTLAAAGLVDGVTAVMPDIPFLAHLRRATEVASTGPYPELANYLGTHRDQVDQVFATLSYFDAVNFAARATAPALFSVALMDTTCPPSTVFAAYHHYAGDADIRVWPYNGHEGGLAHQKREQLRFLAELLPVSARED